jgi:serine/threonine protein phosphatase 1
MRETWSGSASSSIAGQPQHVWQCRHGRNSSWVMKAMMVDPAAEGVWLRNGGVETLASYGGPPDQSHLDWCAALPMMHKDVHRAYVHGGVLEGLPLTEEAQGEEVLLWHRLPQGRDVRCDLHMVHGHTPVLDGPDRLPGRTNLDTGAVFTGRLVVGVFDDDTPGGPIEIIEVRG